ncbi:MAG: glycogen/starch/alpha-glucan phosphorylase [Thermoanaerobaculales bacterium]|jgi:starch phosphorylase|nr:glycogen/starch/alpha-glucan phosphorylase [Thermoanaerobaculales bacterium]
MLPAVHLKNPTAEEFRDRIIHYLRYACGLELRHARAADHLAALELAVRETLIDREILTRRTYEEIQPKTVHYMSLEYLMGRLLHNNLIATELLDVAREAMQMLGLNLDAVLEEEPDPGLGNGGLGRLAACFLDSLATLDYPAYGYGLRYDYGMFRQSFENGWQVEHADTWLQRGFRWEVRRDDLRVPVRFGGRIDWSQSADGRHEPAWADWRTVYGVPYDVLVAGFRTNTVSILRLWDAQAASEFDFHIFSQGNYVRAVAGRERVEALNRVLYPADDVEAGRQLRLAQEYFLVACGVRDAVNRFQRRHAEAWELFPDKMVFQLNDTHPALTVAELMRFFIDEAGLEWALAWELTRASCNYTNHTLLPEALETWPVPLMEQLIPRHVQIIYEINRRFMEGVKSRGEADADGLRRLSILQEEGEKRFRMANLAMVGSRRINGVAKLHTELLRTRVVRDFAELWPDRFLPITNGVTPRRWLRSCNPRLSAAVTRRVGGGWAKDLDRLDELRLHAEDESFQDEIFEIKRLNKVDLAVEVERECGVRLDVDSLFDVQIKRLHEYKRQLLNVMHIILLHQKIKAEPEADIVPRSFIFGAKAAPAYHMAKLIIRLINGVADVVNNDPDVAGRLRVAFLPDYRVSLAERIIPAADLSEQISTAGMEASGTGNMKLALNGALTIGTLDGANIEIRDAVGEENIFIFGLTADEVEERLTTGSYRPWELYREDPAMAAVIDALRNGEYVGADRDAVRGIWSALMEHGDRYMLLADFRDYVECQGRVEEFFRDRRAWARAAILNIAAMGYFSSDRAILEYAEKIWGIEAVAVKTPDGS